METLAFEVIHYEPRIALDGGKDGLDIYRRLIKQLKEVNFQGKGFFEIGEKQGLLFTKIVQDFFPRVRITIKGDLADIDRTAIVNFN